MTERQKNDMKEKDNEKIKSGKDKSRNIEKNYEKNKMGKEIKIK